MTEMPPPFFDGSQPCAQTDPEMFFPEKGYSGELVKAAKQVCAGCEFRQPCLEYAVKTRIEGIALAGIWGGTTVVERRKLADRPKRGPKQPAECGTPSGGKAHARRGEKKCDACQEAMRIYNREANYRRADRQNRQSPERVSREGNAA